MVLKALANGTKAESRKWELFFTCICILIPKEVTQDIASFDAFFTIETFQLTNKDIISKESNAEEERG